MIYFEIGIVLLALFGGYLNANGDHKGFWCWIVTNTYLCGKNAYICEYAQSALFLAYLGLAIYGLIKWRKVNGTKLIK
jgi:hypothetical protein